MPLKTFHKLTEIRKMEIFNATVEEFSMNDYQSASITNVVKKLGISKGGFYRYFKDKKDVYLYLLETTINLRNANIGELFEDTTADFFGLLVTNIKQSIRFDLEHPMFSSFLYNALKERNSSVLGNIHLELKKKQMAVLQKVVIKQLGVGKVRNDISSEMMAFLIVMLQNSLMEYLTIKFNLNLRENIKQKIPVATLPDNDISKIVQDYVSLLKSGIIKALH
jgi:AcrR family transcriptional regulator